MKKIITALCMVVALCLAVPAMAAQKGDAPQPETREAAKQEYRGNTQSRIYHNARCKYFTCKACVVPLTSPADARARGFRACKVCGG